MPPAELVVTPRGYDLTPARQHCTEGGPSGDSPEMPAAAAFLISSGVISGPRYSVMSHSTFGSIRLSSSRYSRARPVLLMGGTRFG